MKDLIHNANVVAQATGYLAFLFTGLLVAAAYISSVREKRWRRRHARRPVARRDRTIDLTGHDFPYAGGGFQHRWTDYEAPTRTQSWN